MLIKARRQPQEEESRVLREDVAAREMLLLLWCAAYN